MTRTPTPDLVDVVVEVPRGSRNKYEHDGERGVMRFDRRILGAIGFPADYGFVPETVATDGDALDALVLLDEPTYPGVWVASRPIGVSWIGTPEGREAKLLCVPDGEPAYAHVTCLADLPEHVGDEIRQFFGIYTRLDDGPASTDEGQEGRESALHVLAESRERWRAAQGRASGDGEDLGAGVGHEQRVLELGGA
jgi:inorganic pyrophosphatase